MEYQNETDLLQEEQDEIGYVDPANKGLRFANYIIDQIVLVVLLNIAVAVWVVIATASGGAGPDKFLESTDTVKVLLVKVLISYVITIVYYTISETVMNGRTIGKLATGTIAVTQDGTPFSFKHALLRSVCRAIPFEALSTFGYLPWHDSLSKTAVVKKTW